MEKLLLMGVGPLGEKKKIPIPAPIMKTYQFHKAYLQKPTPNLPQAPSPAAAA